MVAVNPYKVIDNVYNKGCMKSYNNTYLGDKPPHIYAIANEAYYSLWRKGGNQCVLIRYNAALLRIKSLFYLDFAFLLN